jgi:pimeloyl-ACP methyl ester carboxylesterase
LTARLIETSVPARPEAAVLLLHGGASRRGAMAVSPAQLSVLRMVPIAKRTVRAGRGRLAVFRLLNSTRGWDTHHTPVRDARWALDEIAERFGGRLPTCLIGHSLGGRAALLSAGAPEVRSAVALAPWVLPIDRTGDISGRRILFVHGSRDRIASPQRSATLARSLSREAEVRYACVEGGKHAMLRRHALFDGLAARFAALTLLGTEADGTLDRVLDGGLFVSL